MSPFGDQYFGVYINPTQILLFKHHWFFFKMMFSRGIFTVRNKSALNNIKKMDEYCCVCYVLIYILILIKMILNLKHDIINKIKYLRCSIQLKTMDNYGFVRIIYQTSILL